MGLLPPGDISGCAVVEERPGHERAERVADAGGQLAVGKGPRAALTKLDIGVWVQFAGLFKMPDGPDALIQRRAASSNRLQSSVTRLAFSPVTAPSACKYRVR